MRLTLALALCATTANADILPDVQGLYRADRAETDGICTGVGYDNASIAIEGNQVFFIETTCTLSDPSKLRDMPEGTLYDATCNGEGSVWYERMMVYQTYDGVVVISRGTVRTYRRCE